MVRAPRGECGLVYRSNTKLPDCNLGALVRLLLHVAVAVCCADINGLSEHLLEVSGHRALDPLGAIVPCRTISGCVVRAGTLHRVP